MDELETTSYPVFKEAWIHNYVSAGFSLMPLTGKVPDIDTWSDLQYDPTAGPERFPGNYGVVILPDVVVLDIDYRNMMDGDDAFERFILDNQISPDEMLTYLVQTGSRVRKPGLHYYFSVPKGLNFRSKSKAYPGVQVLGAGHYVVGPGSVHPDTRLPYVVLGGDVRQLSPCPIPIVNHFQRLDEMSGVGMDRYTDDPQTIQRFVAYLRNREGAIQGNNGDEWTYKTAAAGRDFNLSESATHKVMLDVWNEKCMPPWTSGELAIKVKNAYTYALDAPGNKHPGAIFDEVSMAVPDTPATINEEHQRRVDRRAAMQHSSLVWDVKGEYNPDSLHFPVLDNTINNVGNMFKLPHHGKFTNPLFQLLRYNVFSEYLEFTRPAPWFNSFDKGRVEVKDSDFRQLTEYFSKKYRWNPAKQNIVDGALNAGDNHKYHPVVDYYKSLKWDGQPRLEVLLSYYMGAVDNIYTREIGKRLIIAMVKRIMEPGPVKFDHMLILEGAQGIGKSTFCSILGGQWFMEMHLDPHNKDCIQYMLGRTLIELSEMTHNKKSEVEAVKSFLSRDTDIIRLPYDRSVNKYPRKCVIIGTTNEREGYFRDTTGNRRLWPTFCKGLKADALRRDKDQIFAEAMVEWACGAHVYIKDPRVLEFAIEEQAKRIECDPWEDTIERWFAKEKMQGRVYPSISSLQIISEALNLTAKEATGYIARRISVIMSALGWKPCRVDGRRGYRNPDFEQDILDLTEEW